jgi:microcin C transport system substrate-binding protein
MKYTTLLAVFLCSLPHLAHAAPSAALGYEPKYKAGFKHFDYVNPDAPKGGELLLSGYGSFDIINPFLLKGLPVGGTGLIFESLMQRSLDEPFSVYGLLAEDIQLADDKLSVTFRLNPKARFSDGSEVTAEDVKFSFDTLKSPKAHPQFRIYWSDIQEAEVLDKRTVRFKFAKVNPELHLIAADMSIFSKKSVGDKAFDKIVTEPLVGSGPYVIEKYDAGKNVTYKRNPDYWAKDLNVRRGTHNFDRITMKYYKDTNIALEGLKAGDFDFIAVSNSKEWAREYVGAKFDSGEIKKEELPHKNNAGMQGFVFNLRRELFKDVKVRQAINLAYDFEWANKNLFYEQYARCDSYFSNSELAARGLPSKEELALLEPFREQLPKEVFTQAWTPVTTTPPNTLRDNLVKAKNLLTAAGWNLKDGILQNAQGQKFNFEVLLNEKGFERIVAPFAHNLEKLGIKVSYRTVDPALYQQRLDSFDYDMTVVVFGQSQSPGNELMAMWHSSSAKQEGSNNSAGIQNPVVDALIEKVVYAPNRQTLLTAVHALDRVMLYEEYVVPNWFTPVHRIAYWDKFGQPKTRPLYYQAAAWMLETWWKK